MPYKVISNNCRLGGKVLPKGAVLANNEITVGAAKALVANKHLVDMTGPQAAVPAAPAGATAPASNPAPVAASAASVGPAK